uniref:Ankyrin repeat and LEM domain-containing protein 2 n=1 Tax=Callorhinchus milii TaxID=7868 RepID=A0A4W3IPV2_CALMI
ILYNSYSAGMWLYVKSFLLGVKFTSNIVFIIITILTRLKQLSHDELRQEIIDAGLKCGPITPTTRFIFEKRLAQALLVQRAGGETNKVPEPISVSAKPGEKDDSGSPGVSSSCEDGHFGYDVGLNPPDETALSNTNNLAFNGLQTSSQQPRGSAPSASSLYYGVCPVWDDIMSRNDRAHVYSDKKEALQAVKLMKGSRFKAFTSREDAEKFARGICDYYPSPSKSSACVSPVKAGVMYNRDGMSPDVETANRERANSYKSPRSQDLTSKLRKAVEKGDKSALFDYVWSNPRYLIGSGDNPTVLQEGCRYNAMHVAAKENQPLICQFLLDTLENPEFMLLMYPDDNEIMLQKRIKYIVDLYLNTPDKVGFDTPLHFACKFGHAEVVNVLCSHPDIVKTSKNKYEHTPLEVICERSRTHSEELKEKIREYLQDRYYVPLLRDTDNSALPVIGFPWSPEQSDNLSCASLPRLTGNPKDPVMAVRAFAGPMTPSKADEFRRVWKTPPRERTNLFHQFKKADPERGYERVGRHLAHEMGYPWAEYWEFLGCFTDLAMPEGLRRIEEYLSRKESSKRHEHEGDNFMCNKFKSPPSSGKTSKYCNSISVSAFLDDDDDDISLEEIKNRQNAALNISKSLAGLSNSPGAIEENGCHILPVERAVDIIDSTDALSLQTDKEISPSLNGVCTPIAGERHSRSQTNSICETLLSPVSNLMAEFEKLSLRDNEEERHLFGERSATCLMAEQECEEMDSENEPDTESGEGKLTQVSAEIEKPAAGDRGVELYSAALTLFPFPPLSDEPSKLDRDVLAAVKGVDIDGQMFPCLSRWKTGLQSYSASEMESWPSPAVLKRRPNMQSLTPGSPCSTLGRPSPLCYSPAKHGSSSHSVEVGSPGRYSPAYASHSQRRHRLAKAECWGAQNVASWSL